MPEFLRLIPPAHALDTLMRSIPMGAGPERETVETADALGRVLVEPIQAPHPLPAFARSTVDGYAVRASDTHGASPSLPAYLKIIGEIPMGAAPSIEVGGGQAALIHTGGAIPQGADAVVMIEDTQQIRQLEIEVLRPAAVGTNVLEPGEDVKRGEVVLEDGRPLRPQEIGGLMALGITRVEVAKRPKVGILSTGDEVVPPASDPRPGQVRDVNSHTLCGLVTQAGGEPVLYGIIPDELEELQEAAAKSHTQDDIVVITAGSSVSARDITSEVIAGLGDPGILVHGVAIRPGKPTILAVAEGVPIIGLPGNPVSALVVAGLFVTPVIRRLLGVAGPALQPWLPAKLSTNVASETGREDYLPVRLESTTDGWLAHPVYGRSNLIFTLVRANGLVRIPPQATGLGEGEAIEVVLF